MYDMVRDKRNKGFYLIIVAEEGMVQVKARIPLSEPEKAVEAAEDEYYEIEEYIDRKNLYISDTVTYESIKIKDESDFDGLKLKKYDL